MYPCRDLGNPFNPNPNNPAFDPERHDVLPTHSISFIYEYPSSSVGVQGIPGPTRGFSDTRTIQTAGISPGQLLRGTTISPHELLTQPIQGKF